MNLYENDSKLTLKVEFNEKNKDKNFIKISFSDSNNKWISRIYDPLQNKLIGRDLEIVEVLINKLGPKYGLNLEQKNQSQKAFSFLIYTQNSNTQQQEVQGSIILEKGSINLIHKNLNIKKVSGNILSP